MFYVIMFNGHRLASVFRVLTVAEGECKRLQYMYPGATVAGPLTLDEVHAAL